MKLKELVFVCSPYSGCGDIETNIKIVKRYCQAIIQQGKIPIAPHLYFPQFLDDNNEDERKTGIDCGKLLMEKCDSVAIYTTDGKMTKGMQSEYNYALKLQKPIAIYDNKDYHQIIHRILPKYMDYYTFKGYSFSSYIMYSYINPICDAILPFDDNNDGYYIIEMSVDKKDGLIWQSPAFKFDKKILNKNLNCRLLIDIFDLPESLYKYKNIMVKLYKIEVEEPNVRKYIQKHETKIILFKKTKGDFVELNLDPKDFIE